MSHTGDRIDRSLFSTLGGIPIEIGSVADIDFLTAVAAGHELVRSHQETEGVVVMPYERQEHSRRRMARFHL